ncbi:hypothetical protein P692DRAFT_20361218 [Suillus brevipes Sb2]|nr:hypothetical protein P692DRAFT_20361218 [Suillus brevipes Sb2]
MSEATAEFVVEDVRFVSIIAGHCLSACHFKVPELPKSNQLSIVGWDMGLMRQNIPSVQHSRCLQSLILFLHGPFHMENPSGDMPSFEYPQTALSLWLPLARLHVLPSSGCHPPIISYRNHVPYSCYPSRNHHSHRVPGGVLQKISMVDYLLPKWWDFGDSQPVYPCMQGSTIVELKWRAHMEVTRNTCVE